MNIFNIVILSISGLLLTFVGVSRLTNPIKNYLKNSGIQLANEGDLLNEMRGVGSLMLCAGIITLLGTFFLTMTFTSLVVAALIFIGFAIGRIISSGKDGKPNDLIKRGLISELVLGGLNVVGLVLQLV